MTKKVEVCDNNCNLTWLLDEAIIEWKILNMSAWNNILLKTLKDKNFDDITVWEDLMIDINSEYPNIITMLSKYINDDNITIKPWEQSEEIIVTFNKPIKSCISKIWDDYIITDIKEIIAEFELESLYSSGWEHNYANLISLYIKNIRFVK